MLLSLSAVRKSFAGVHALKGVDFDLRPGEVHALVGENGAGKSTLMKILSGAEPRNGGEMAVAGRPIGDLNPSLAQQLGIAIIYQEFNLIPFLSVAENIFLGREPRKALGIVDYRKMNADAA